MSRTQNLTLILLAALLASCGSSPKETDYLKAPVVPQEKWKFRTPEAVLEHANVKGNPPEVYEKPIEEVRMSALRALNLVGCQIKHREAYYVAGRRPNRIGVFVGSGGETVQVFLYPVSTHTTHAWVDTDLSFVGIAGQKGWDKPVKQVMRNALNTPLQLP